MALPENSRPKLEGKAGSLEVADGGCITSYGSAIFTLCVGGLQIQQRFIVADIASPAILGFDFFKINKCFLDASKACIWLNGQPVGCQARRDATSAFKVKLRETVTIPPLSEMIVSARVDGHPSYTCAVIETLEKSRFCYPPGETLEKSRFSYPPGETLEKSQFSYPPGETLDLS